MGDGDLGAQVGQARAGPEGIFLQFNLTYKELECCLMLEGRAGQVPFLYFPSSGVVVMVVGIGNGK
jgi:hypothetical protein